MREFFESLLVTVYFYCTDLIINLANIFNLSYYEINFLVFCVLYPLLLIGSIAIYLLQRKRYERIKAIKNKTKHTP